MLKRFLVVALIVLLGTLLILAESGFDDAGNINDPNENDRANACYEGGTLEGKCITDLEWIAGWYLIRFEFGIFSADDIPAELAWVLPQEIKEEVEPIAPAATPDPSVTEEPL